MFTETAGIEQGRSVPPRPFPGNRPQYQQQAIIALNCILDHLCFIAIYFVRLLTRCVQRYQKSLREAIFWGLGTLKKIQCKLLLHLMPFWLTKGIGMLYFWIMGATCIPSLASFHMFEPSDVSGSNVFVWVLNILKDLFQQHTRI